MAEEHDHDHDHEHEHDHDHCCDYAFHAGHTFVILANNGKYLSRIHRRGVDFIEAEKESIDCYCRFRASVLGDGKIALRADDGAHNYLSRVCKIGLNNIEAAKTSIDEACEFLAVSDETVFPPQWNRAHYIYLKADNGKYLGIVDRGNQNGKIEANYNSKCEATRFIVLEAK